MNKKILGVFLFAVFTMSSVWAQGRKGLRINEVLVTNETNYQDDYGCQSAWIEIFNTTFGTVDIRSCYLTNDRNNPKKYPIPKGDVLTEMPPRQHLLFWADDMPNRGTFHVNFKLDPDKDNWIGLYDANGKDLIDSVTVPAGIPADHSYARIDDGVRTVVPAEAWHITQHTTPGSNNVVKDKNEKMDRLQEADPNGFVMTITAMLVVFSGLLILFLAYKLVGIMAMRLEGRKESLNRRLNSRLHQESAEKASTTEDPLVAVAISLALTSELEMGGGEAPGRLTIRPRTLPYTPWSDKSQMMRPTVDCKRLKA